MRSRGWPGCDVEKNFGCLGCDCRGTEHPKPNISNKIDYWITVDDNSNVTLSSVHSFPNRSSTFGRAYVSATPAATTSSA